MPRGLNSSLMAWAEQRLCFVMKRELLELVQREAAGAAAGAVVAGSGARLKGYSATPGKFKIALSILPCALSAKVTKAPATVASGNFARKVS